jgi:hypothetical protein
MTHPDCEGCRKALQWAVDLIAQAMADEDSSLDAFDSEQFLKEAKNLGFDYRKPSPAPAKPCAPALTEEEREALAHSKHWPEDVRLAVLASLVRRLLGQGETR